MAVDITGDLCKIQGDLKFEWNIKRFLELRSELDESYESPEFSFYDVSWVIEIYPYGERKHESVGYIGVYLKSKSLLKPVTMNVSLNFKTDGEKSDLEKTYTRLFNKEAYWGWNKFILRSDLIKRKSELLPSDVLTVICILKNGETNAVSEKTYQNAFTQTVKTAKATYLDASAQTKEGVGVWELQQHLQEISLNGDISDIILKVEDQEFKSHRCILAARSPVFSAMMTNEMKENVTGVVDIEDVDPKTFSDFLSYLYTGSTKDLTSENITELYRVADKYQVEVLKQHCLDQMLMNVSIENFCDIFMLSIQHNEEKLKQACIQYFAKHSLHIIETCKWQTFLSENPIVGNELFIKLLRLNKMNMFDDDYDDDDDMKLLMMMTTTDDSFEDE